MAKQKDCDNKSIQNPLEVDLLVQALGYNTSKHASEASRLIEAVPESEREQLRHGLASSVDAVMAVDFHAPIAKGHHDTAAAVVAEDPQSLTREEFRAIATQALTGRRCSDDFIANSMDVFDRVVKELDGGRLADFRAEAARKWKEAGAPDGSKLEGGTQRLTEGPDRGTQKEKD